MNWYASPTGNDSADCQSPATACASINNIIARPDFLPGDLLLVAAGTFTGTSDPIIQVDKYAILSGGWNADFTAQFGQTVVDGQDQRTPLVIWWDGKAEVSRFRFIHSGGAGVHAFRDFTCDNCTFEFNQNGVEHENGVSALITLNHSIVRRNHASGVVAWGPVTINDSAITDNAGNGIFTANHLTLNNSTVSRNGTTGIVEYNQAEVSSSTISENTGSEFGGVVSNGTFIIRNSLIANNKGLTAPDCKGTVYSGGYNLVGSTSGCTLSSATGDLLNVPANLGPLIGAPDQPGYHPLLAGSPAINAGNPAGCSGSGGPLLADQRGHVRVSRCDIGAYEYAAPGPATQLYPLSGPLQRTSPLTAFSRPLQAVVMDSAGSPVGGVVVTFSAPSAGASGTFSNGIGQESVPTGAGGVAASSTFTANAIAGKYSVAALADSLPDAAIGLENGWLYITPTGSDLNLCDSPGTACATVEGTLAKMLDTEQVLVQAGSYTWTNTFTRDAVVHGGWNADFTAQDGMSLIHIDNHSGAYSCLSFVAGKSVSIDHFAFASYCNLTVEGTLLLTESTIEHIFIRNLPQANLTLRDVFFQGGKVGNYGTALVDSCILSGDNFYISTGDDLEILVNYSGTMTIVNSTIARPPSVTEQGGGIHNAGSMYIINSTIANNSSWYGAVHNVGGTLDISSSTIYHNANSAPVWGGGGIYNESGTVRLRNTILAGNSANNGPDCYGDITSDGYNLIGTSNGCRLSLATGDLLNRDPRLFPTLLEPGVLPLLPGSPAINAANPAGCADGLGKPLTTDQRGTARYGRCDIGAYEYNPDDDLLHYCFLPTTTKSCVPLFQDNFSNPASGWPNMDTGNTLYQYNNGEYRILVRQPGWASAASAGFAAENFSALVTARDPNNIRGSYGIAFDVTADWSYFYSIEIYPNGGFGIYLYTPFEIRTLAEGSSSAIKTGTASNRIKVSRSGTTVKVYANGQMLTTVQTNYDTGGHTIGLLAATIDQKNLDVRFDDFAVYPVTCGENPELQAAADGSLAPSGAHSAPGCLPVFEREKKK